MHTNHEPDDPEVLKAMGYDRRDLDVPVIRSATTWIFLSCVACFVVGLFVYNYLTTPGSFMQRVMGTKREPIAATRLRMDKDTPILQDNITTKVDIEQMRRDERERMEVPAWIDQNKGTVRIPIDRAIDLVAQRGVSTGNTVPAKTQGNTIVQNAVGPAK